MVPTGWLCNRFGSRKLLTISIFLQAGLTILSPSAAYLHWTLLAALRLAQGFFQVVFVLPLIGPNFEDTD